MEAASGISAACLLAPGDLLIQLGPSPMKKRSEFASMIDTVIFDATSDSGKEREVADIITFCEDPKLLNLMGQDPPFELWPMQKIVLKLFYRGTRGNENLELTEEEIGLLNDIAENEELDYRPEQGGFWQVVEKYKRRSLHNILLLVMGRRSSKTAIVSIIASYEAYKLCECPEGNPNKFYNIPMGKKIAILNVAVSGDQAYDPLFIEIESRIASAPYFEDKINHAASAKQSISILTDADKRENALRKERGMKIMLDGSVVLKSGHSNSASLRGGASICVLFDEFAHFMTSSGKQSGDEVYNALVPSTQQFGLDGKVVLLSDPRGKEGMFWRLFEMAQDREAIQQDEPEEGEEPKPAEYNYLHDEVIALQLPTWRMNPNEEFSEEHLVRTKRPIDPIAFYSTWNARFQGEAGDRMFNEQKLMECVDHGMFPAKFGHPRYEYFIHLDPAVSSHNYALALVHVVRMTNENRGMRKRVIVDLVKYWKPTKDGPVSIMDVENTIRDLCRKFRVQKVTFDAFQSAQTIERLKMQGIRAEETPFTAGYITKVYNELSNLINENNLSLYHDEQAVGELKHLRYKVTARGFKRMFDERSPFPADDVADAIAGACYQALNSNKLNSLPRSGLVRTTLI
jgi:hypothetical protein